MKLPKKIENIKGMVEELYPYSPYHRQSNDPTRYRDVLEHLLKLENRHNTWYYDLSKELGHIRAVIIFCIMHSAQQFNFWYGNNKYKPFSGGTIVNTILHCGPSGLKKDIKNSCLGFIPERLRYLEECQNFNSELDTCLNLEAFIEKMLDLDSFNTDPFFKKGLLAIIEIRRILDNFYDKSRLDYIKADKFFSKELIDQFPIPADYRIPEWLGNKGLMNQELFFNKEFFPNSVEETFLRASTIKEVEILSMYCDLAPYQIDGLIFMDKSKDNNFHMCMTTAY